MHLRQVCKFEDHMILAHSVLPIVGYVWSGGFDLCTSQCYRQLGLHFVLGRTCRTDGHTECNARLSLAWAGQRNNT